MSADGDADAISTAVFSTVLGASAGGLIVLIINKVILRAVMVLCQDCKDWSFFLDQGLVLWVKAGPVLEWSLYLAYSHAT